MNITPVTFHKMNIWTSPAERIRAALAWWLSHRRDCYTNCHVPMTWSSPRFSPSTKMPTTPKPIKIITALLLSLIISSSLQLALEYSSKLGELKAENCKESCTGTVRWTKKTSHSSTQDVCLYKASWCWLAIKAVNEQWGTYLDNRWNKFVCFLHLLGKVNSSGGSIYRNEVFVGKGAHEASEGSTRGVLYEVCHRFSNFQSCKDARNLDYMNFSTRVGVSDDVIDVTKHDWIHEWKFAILF